MYNTSIKARRGEMKADHWHALILYVNGIILLEGSL